MTDSAGFLYIIQSEKSAKYYLGSTINLSDRIDRHNTGRVTATRNKGPWKYVCVVGFQSSALARRAEQFIKKLHRKDILQMIIEQDFKWPEDLGSVEHVSID